MVDIIKLDEPKKNFDWEDVRDMIDGVGRHIDSLYETIKKQREQLDQNIELDRLKSEEIKHLKAEIKRFKGGC